MRRIPVLLVSAALLAQQAPLERAWDLLAKGQRQQATAAARRIVDTNPRDGQARLFLGSILAEDGLLAEALVQLREAARLLPRSADAQHALGDALTRAGDGKAARAAFVRAVSLKPDFAEAHAALGLLLLQDGDAKSAMVHLNRAIQGLGDSPEAAQPRYLRARIRSDSGEVEEAEADLKKAVALQPNFAEAWSDLGQVRKALLDDDGALAAFERSVALDGANAVARYRLGAELLRRGDNAGAEKHLRESYRLNPRNQSTLYSLQLVLGENGKAEEAAAIRRELAAVLREIDRESQSAFVALRLNNEGAALEKTGDLRAALHKYREAVALDPEHVGYRLNFAVALLRLGQWKEGITELRDSARRDPQNDVIRRALEDALEQAPIEFGGKGKARKN